MANEEEVLLLPCLPLVNRAGENLEPGLWNFKVESPRASSAVMNHILPHASDHAAADQNTEQDSDLPPAMIDYIHPGSECLCC